MNLKNFFPALLFTIGAGCASQTGGQGQFSPLIVDSTLVGKFQLANGNDRDFLSLGVAQGFWFFSDDTTFSRSFPGNKIDVFLDTVRTLMPVVCDCMIRSDTVYVQGGIGYQGAIGFDLKIANNSFEGRTMLSGRGYRVSDTANFVRDIYLSSARQTLGISDLDSLKPGKILLGQLSMESVGYQEKADTSTKKMYMKVIFKCRLDDVLAL